VSGDEPVEALLRRGIADRRRRRDAWLTALRGGLVQVVDSQQLDRQRGAAARPRRDGAGSSAATLVRALDRILPRTRSALTATALLCGAAAALAAAALAAAAREELRRIGSLVPEQAVQSVKADVAAGTDAASTR